MVVDIIDTDLLLIITTTADELSGGTNIDDLERPWTPKIGVLSDVLLFLAVTHTYSEFSLKYTGDRPRQPAYEIKLMLWRVSWALAQISC